MNDQQNFQEIEPVTETHDVSQEKSETHDVSEQKPARKGKKIAIISAVCAVCMAVIALAIIFVPTLLKSGLFEKPPILPEGLSFGMTIDSFYEAGYGLDKTKQADYDPSIRGYTEFLLTNQVREKLPLESGKMGFVYFNKSQQLYKLSYSTEATAEAFDILCQYYEKAFGNIEKESIEEGKATVTIATFKSSGIQCVVQRIASDDYDDIRVTIEDEAWKPYMPEISKTALNNALQRYNYKAGIFSINLLQLIDKYVSNAEYINYSPADPIANAKDTTDYKKYFSELENGAYLDNIATSYIVVIHGDICKNPSLPYYKTEDVDIIKLLFIFDDSQKLVGTVELDACEDLHTCAVLTMYS